MAKVITIPKYKEYMGVFKGGRVFNVSPQEVLKEAREKLKEEEPIEWKAYTGEEWITIPSPIETPLTKEVSLEPPVETISEVPGGVKTYEEYKEKYVGKPSAEKPLSEEEISEIYKTYIGREPTPEEIEHHITRRTPKERLVAWAKVSPEAIREREKLINPKAKEIEPEPERIPSILPKEQITIDIPSIVEGKEPFGASVSLLKSALDVVKSQVATFNDYLSQLKQVPTVKAPDLVKEYEELRAKEGYDDALKRLIATEEKIKDVKAKYEKYLAEVEQAPIRYSAIVGRQAAIRREMNAELEPLLTEYQIRQAEVNAINNTINTIIDLHKVDYETARQEVNDQYTRYKDIVNSIERVFDTSYTALMNAAQYMSSIDLHRSVIERENRDNNRALLNVALEATKGMKWEELSKETQDNIQQLAIASGFSPSFPIETLFNTIADKKLIATFTNNRGDVSLIFQTPKGIETQILEGAGQREIKLPRYQLITDDEGNVYRINLDTGEKASLGKIGKGKTITQAEQIKEIVGSIAKEWEANYLENGYVNPEIYKETKKFWIQKGYAGTDFDEYFYIYADPSRVEEYNLPVELQASLKLEG